MLKGDQIPPGRILRWTELLGLPETFKKKRTCQDISTFSENIPLIFRTITEVCEVHVALHSTDYSDIGSALGSGEFGGHIGLS